MKQYVTTKLVRAKPLTRLEYCQYRGWTLPENETGDDKGYLVKDLECQPYSLKMPLGHIVWLPEKQFEAGYLCLENVENLPPHQQRVIAEKVLLDEKLKKLSDFIASDNFGTIVKDDNDRLNLTKQETIMKEYSAILEQRIKAF